MIHFHVLCCALHANKLNVNSYKYQGFVECYYRLQLGCPDSLDLYQNIVVWADRTSLALASGRLNLTAACLNAGRGIFPGAEANTANPLVTNMQSVVLSGGVFCICWEQNAVIHWSSGNGM